MDRASSDIQLAELTEGGRTTGVDRTSEQRGKGSSASRPERSDKRDDPRIPPQDTRVRTNFFISELTVIWLSINLGEGVRGSAAIAR